MKPLHYFVTLLVFFIIGCNPKGKYLTSPDGKYHLTLFEQADDVGKSYTFIAYGKIKEKKMPDSYVKVRNKHSDAWYCLVTWEGSKLIIYQPYSDFTEHFLGEKMELREMRDKEFSKIFFSNKEDQYIRLSSYNKNSL